jgi:uncharacterized protein YecE (DUF72 family)
MIYVGTSGWSYDHWTGIFYPEDLHKNRWLPFYSGHFSTVELNMSFYRYPFQNMLKGWKNKLPESFKMTFKAHRQITHRKKFQDVRDPLDRFYGMAGSMKDHTGCILFQAPPAFRKNQENWEILVNFLEMTNPSFENVIEFRHYSWWEEQTVCLLKQHNVAFCTVSGLDMPSDVMVSADFGYFRFHGPREAYASEYSERQLQAWGEKIRDAVNERDLQRVYCYFNNDFHGYAVNNAKKLNQILQSLVKS